MKKIHGEMPLMKSILLRKKKLSPRFWLFTLGFPDNPSLIIDPGNHVKIFPDNDPEEVNDILKKLNQTENCDAKMVWDSK